MRGSLKFFLYVCDSCGSLENFCSDSAARASKWVVSSSFRYPGFKSCWCPLCAFSHRRGKGATGRPRSNRSEFVSD